MTIGYFQLLVTARNTGPRNFIPGTYTGLDIIAPDGTRHSGTWAKKNVTLGPGESSQIQLQSQELNWPSGTYTYDIRLYYKALQEGDPATGQSGWTIYFPGTGSPDVSAQLAQKTGTIIVT